MRALLEFGKLVMVDAHENQFKAAALGSFMTHFFRCDLEKLFAAYLLDPNHRLEFLTRESIRPALVFIHFLVRSNPEFRVIRQTELASRVTREIEVYIVELKALRPGKIDPYMWWKSKSTMPFLGYVGMRLSCCHSSSTNTERVFSALNRIISPLRNRLDMSTVMDMLSIRMYNLSIAPKRCPRPEISEHRAGASRPLPSSPPTNPSSQPGDDDLDDHDEEDLMDGGDILSTERSLLDQDYLQERIDRYNLQAIRNSGNYAKFLNLVNYTKGPIEFMESRTPSSSSEDQLISSEEVANHANLGNIDFQAVYNSGAFILINHSLCCGLAQLTTCE